jgi:hypothetical protein
VGVGKHHGILESSLGQKAVSQPADSRPGVHDDDGIVRGADFQAGGVSSVFEVFGTGDGNGAPGAPAANQHADILFTLRIISNLRVISKTNGKPFEDSTAGSLKAKYSRVERSR